MYPKILINGKILSVYMILYSGLYFTNDFKIASQVIAINYVNVGMFLTQMKYSLDLSLS